MQKRMTPGTPNLLRLVNRNTILFYLEHMEVTSRAELSALSGLSPPTVSAVIKDLLEEGWACEVGNGVSQGGKRPQLINLNPNARRIAAVQLNQQCVRVRLTNMIGDVLSEQQYKPKSDKAASVADEVIECVRFLIRKHESNTDVLGMGVAVPGVVDDKGNVSNAPEFGWDNAPLRDLLTAKLDIPVVVENDVKLAALGEGWRRKMHSGTMVYVHLDHGIGAGVLIDGRLYRGAHFAAGEMSNLIVNSDTVRERAEQSGISGLTRGPFENSYGLDALVAATDRMSAVDASNAASAPGAENVLSQSNHVSHIVRHLAYGVSNLITILDPHTIVFGGEMTTKIEDFIPRFREEIRKYAPITPELHLTLIGRDASLYGATRAVMNDYQAQVTWTSV